MCDVLGYSRQAYYKQLRNKSEWLLKDQIIVESVHQIREHLPKTGTVKILKECQQKWSDKGIKIGRDKTFTVLRHYGLLQRKHRNKKPQTTMSQHWLKKYPDLIKEQNHNHNYVLTSFEGHRVIKCTFCPSIAAI